MPNDRQSILVGKALAELLGHTSTIDALRHAIEMRSALKVIHTWAGVPGALEPKHVRNLTARALRKGGEAKA